MNIKSDKRIEAILREIEKYCGENNSICDNMCYGICDIGTDHGFVPAETVLRGIVPRAIATDISEKSLEKARKLFADLGIADKTETRTGDGLSAVGFDEAKVFVIAGMGGHNIAEILRGRTPLEYNRFVFVPHTNAYFLRDFLCRSGYEILSDRCAGDSGKFYDVISAAYRGKEFCFDIAGGEPFPESVRGDFSFFESADGVFLPFSKNGGGDFSSFSDGARGDFSFFESADSDFSPLFKNADGRFLPRGAIREIFLHFGRDNFLSANEDFRDKLIKKVNEFDNILKRVYNIKCKEQKSLFDSALSLYDAINKRT
ncbi:MAG: class I SAM-dependent methyltransferase [Clostridiales bacterium]|jgi:tRNA A22 N-methylase|nr:class I SAM-dependent methyltransferase [Clostridiales bacterium]